MNNKRQIYGTALAFGLFIALGLVCGQAAYGQSGNASFPSGFVGTWKRDNFNNTLTFTATTVKSSSRDVTWKFISKSGGTFTMSGGEISGNTAGSGGGIIDRDSGNTAGNGGGVYVASGYFGGSLTKKGGTIYGYTARDDKSNVVKNNYGVVQNKGHAIFIDDSRFRESTAGPADNPDPSKNGLAGGWGY